MSDELSRPTDLRRVSNAIPNIAKLGIQIQSTSLPMTASPRPLKNPAPIGETSIGRHGKKNRSLLNGANKATPKPPFVNISSKVCDEVMIVKYTISFHLDMLTEAKQSAAARDPTKSANKNECVIPRWPNMLVYGTRKMKAITSASGNTGQTAVSIQKRGGADPDLISAPATVPNMACEKIVGIK